MDFEGGHTRDLMSLAHQALRSDTVDKGALCAAASARGGELSPFGLRCSPRAVRGHGRDHEDRHRVDPVQKPDRRRRGRDRAEDELQDAEPGDDRRPANLGHVHPPGRGEDQQDDHQQHRETGDEQQLLENNAAVAVRLRASALGRLPLEQVAPADEPAVEHAHDGVH